MNVRAKLLEGKKLRMKTWYYGKYIYSSNKRFYHEDNTPCPNKYIPVSDVDNQWELYNEELHGIHNEKKNDNN